MAGAASVDSGSENLSGAWTGVVAEGDGHFGRAIFIVVGLSAFLVGRSDSNGVDTVDIAISCTGVKTVAPIPRCPYIDVSLPIPPLHTHTHTHTHFTNSLKKLSQFWLHSQVSVRLSCQGLLQ